jgi:hypothetical protein
MKKKYTLISKKWPTLILFSLSACVPLWGQVLNNGNLNVADFGKFHINEATFDFGSASALSQTSRSGANYGFVSFAENATWINASDDHHIDGYVRYYGDQFFIAPVGQSGLFVPAAIDADNDTGVDVAYFHSAPSSLGATLATGVEKIATVGYWKISGATPARVSLTWRPETDVDALLLTPSLTYLTLLGFDGTEWVAIPSFFDLNSILGGNSDLANGSITSNGTINLSAYQAFTIGAKQDAACYPVVVSSGNTKTWNGSSWSPNAPTLSDPVVINGAYNAGSFSCYSVVLNADISLTNGETLDVVDGFSGAGKVIMASEASVLQRNTNATPPKIVMTKVTNPMRRFDYVFLSSPLNLFAPYFSQITSAANTAVNGNFSAYTNSAFYNYFTDNDTTNSIPVTSSNVPVGRGFAATVRPNQAPYALTSTPGSWFTEKYPVHIKAEGTTNNGDIAVPMPSGVAWARLGNPYPSPINGLKLLDELGNDIRKTIYFWSYNTPRQNWETNVNNYNIADYATFNYLGGVASCGTCPEPTGMIATMQSVYVRKLNPSPISFSMTNCLRDLYGNNTFYRMAQTTQGKFRLNLNGSSGSFSQIMIGYNTTATLGYDNGYDSARMLGAITSEMNSLIDGQTTGYAIQTRPSFETTDVVPLQIVKRLDETFTINLHNKDGIFNSSDISIFLHDKDLNLYHDFTDGAYSFVQSATPDNDRFEIVYEEGSLDNEEIVSNDAMAFIENNTFHAQSKFNMSEIEIYDLTGRLIITYSRIQDTILNRPFHHAQSVYIAKIKLEDGSVVSQKVINP